MSETAKGAASAWLAADEDVRHAGAVMASATQEYNRALARQEDAAKRLQDVVGRNVTTRLWQFDNDIVIVEHERGIRRLRVEP